MLTGSLKYVSGFILLLLMFCLYALQQSLAVVDLTRQMQGADSIGGGGNSKDDRLQGLALRLLQLLCSCWLECSPGQLRTSPEMELVQVRS